MQINFYQNRSSIVKVMTKKWVCFYASQCSSSIVRIFLLTVLTMKFIFIEISVLVQLYVVL